MAVDNKVLLQASNRAEVAAGAPPKSEAAVSGKTIEGTDQIEDILLQPDTYIGSSEKLTQTLWVYEDEQMVHRRICYVPGLCKIFDEILANAADDKQRYPSMDSVKVEIDVEKNSISVYNNRKGVPLSICGPPEKACSLTNIFSTEFVIETADASRQVMSKQVFKNNMRQKFDPVITKCNRKEKWTKVSFHPDLARFNMTRLEDDVVALMKKRVVDLACTLGKSVKVELNGQVLPVKSFTDYVNLYLQPDIESNIPRIFHKLNNGWEICVTLSDGQFQQVSLVNGFATIKGGTHVEDVTSKIIHSIMCMVNEKRDANVTSSTVQNRLWVFVNSMIDHPAFDSPTKETLTTTPRESFQHVCELSKKFLKKVKKSGLVDCILQSCENLTWSRKDWKKTYRPKDRRVARIDAYNAGGRNSRICNSILTVGDSAEALAPGTHLDQKEEKLIRRQWLIPSMVDGLNRLQRKILFLLCLESINLAKKFVVAELSHYVSTYSTYHFKEAIRTSTIVRMAQNLVGSNNLNLLKPIGQFGTRMGGRKCHYRADRISTQLSPITRYLFPKDDDILLHYLKENDQSLEPTWYVPVIPTVLVNGSGGGRSRTYIPNYKPEDIVGNIRCLLNNEPMKPMKPWYQGFNGIIKESDTEDDSYITTGVIKKTGKTTLHITELPVGLWTRDYHSFLIKEGKAEDSFIKDVIQGSGISTVDIEVTLSEEKFAMAKQEDLLEKFKLTKKISTRNMRLLDSNGTIKKYDTPELILLDFYPVRLALYEKRKQVVVRNLETELVKVKNKARYICAVVEEDIILSDDLAHLSLELHRKKFARFKETKVAGSCDEDSEIDGSGDVPISDYHYLFSIPMRSLKMEEVFRLNEEEKQITVKLDMMKKATPESLWLNDLATLETHLIAGKLDRKEEQDEIAMVSKFNEEGGLQASEAAPKNPRKNTKKAPEAEPVPESMEPLNSSSIETGSGRKAPLAKGDDKSGDLDSDVQVSTSSSINQEKRMRSCSPSYPEKRRKMSGGHTLQARLISGKSSKSRTWWTKEEDIQLWESWKVSTQNAAKSKDRTMDDLWVSVQKHFSENWKGKDANVRTREGMHNRWKTLKVELFTQHCSLRKASEWFKERCKPDG